MRGRTLDDEGVKAAIRDDVCAGGGAVANTSFGTIAEGGGALGRWRRLRRRPGRAGGGRGGSGVIRRGEAAGGTRILWLMEDRVWIGAELLAWPYAGRDRFAGRRICAADARTGFFFFVSGTD